MVTESQAEARLRGVLRGDIIWRDLRGDRRGGSVGSTDSSTKLFFAPVSDGAKLSCSKLSKSFVPLEENEEEEECRVMAAVLQSEVALNILFKGPSIFSDEVEVCGWDIIVVLSSGMSEHLSIC